MKTLARITSAFFLLVGGLLVLAGLGVALFGFVRVSGGTAGINMLGMVRMLNWALGFALTFQGMTLLALGEGLWLLVDLVNAQETLVRFVRRGSSTSGGGRR